jgi:hypothetical protein
MVVCGRAFRARDADTGQRLVACRLVRRQRVVSFLQVLSLLMPVSVL